MRFAPALLVLAAGCLGPAAVAPSANWTVEADKSKVAKAPAPKWDGVRIARLDVRAPFDGRRLAVMRADGSVAFDPVNSFAAAPADLLLGAAQDVLAASGEASVAAPPRTAAATPRTLEVTVTRLALSGAGGQSLRAEVALTVALVENRAVAASVAAEASSAVGASRNFTAAFSAAFSSAMSDALKRL